MSLADELLADLEDEELVEETEQDGGEGLEEVDEQLPSMSAYDRVGSVAKLLANQNYKDLINKMQEQLNLKEIPPVTKPLEADPQYKLIVELSGLAAEVDQELNVIHKFVRDKYEKRFPELESLVPNALEYLATVKLLGNDISTKGQNKQILSEILAPATCIVVSVTASTTQGKALEPDELVAVQEACDMAEQLHTDRLNMYQLVESRMALIAPNLCEILGAGTAAMIVAKAGGLAPLARLPACNVLILGAQKKTLSGFSSTAVLPHAGFLFFHPVVQGVPPDLRQKAARLLAAKTTLAARVDFIHESSDGSIGKNLFEQIKQKIEKMLEPPPVKAAKPLPKPLDKASKKRGGRRVRKMKERLGMTELRKKSNRMNFGELAEDVIQENMGFSLGQALSGPSSGSRIRNATVDPKTRARMSQKLQKTMERQRSMGGVTSIRSRAAGTASSVTFTPVLGLEIVNPTVKPDHEVLKYKENKCRMSDTVPSARLSPAPIVYSEATIPTSENILVDLTTDEGVHISSLAEHTAELQSNLEMAHNFGSAVIDIELLEKEISVKEQERRNQQYIDLSGEIAGATSSKARNFTVEPDLNSDFDTLDEPIWNTIRRDLRTVGAKFGQVMVPKSSQQLLRDWDLWGPLFICVFISLMLQGGRSGKGPHFTEVFTLTFFGSCVVTLNTKLLGGNISFFQSLCVLGYCLLPPGLAAVICKFIEINSDQTPFLFFLRLLVTTAGFIWAIYASMMFISSSQPPKRKLLALYPIFLFYFVVSWIIISHSSF